MKFRKALMLFSLIFSLAPLYFVSLWTIYENDKNTEELVRQNLETLSNVQIMQIADFCNTREEQLTLLSNYGIVIDSCIASLDDEMDFDESVMQALDNVLKEQKEISSYVASLSIIDKNLKLVASSEKYTRGKDSGLSVVTPQYLNGDFAMGKVYTRKDGNKEIRVVAAYKGIKDKKTGKLLGYVFEEIFADFFDLTVKDNTLQSNVYIRIVDGEGVEISAGSIGESNEFEHFATIEDNKDFVGKWNAIDWENNSYGCIEYPVNGKNFITYYSTVPYTGWKIQVTSGMAIYRARQFGFIKEIAICLIVTTLLLIVVNVKLSKKLTGPIGDISKVLKDVQENNDYTLRINLKGRDEISQLANDIDKLLCFVEEVDTKQQERNMQLSRRADRDPLTGIFNKEAIGKYIEWMLSEQASDEKVAVGFVDIDNFRDYNTQYGHLEGDRVIKLVANSLKEVFGKGVGRNGGDEFLFMVQMRDRDRLEEQVKRFMDKLHTGILLDGAKEPVRVNISVGVAIAQVSDTTRQLLENKADEAMYKTKENGKDGYTILE